METAGLSICLTSFNRSNILFEALEYPLQDIRIKEIIVIDDASDIGIFNTIQSFALENSKIRLYRNDSNKGCYFNKKIAISLSSSEWVCILDSDNKISKQYIDAIYKHQWNRKTVFQPTFASPHFDFRKYSGKLIGANNVAQFVEDPTFTTALNAMNYFVHRDEYLRVWEDCPEPWTSDSLLQNYNWLNAGNSIYFCPGLEYFHRVEDHGNEEESHYKKHNHRTKRGFHEGLIRKLKAMR